MKPALPDLNTLKNQAKKLRSALADAGNETTHSAALEILAAQLGYRDWNTLCAAIPPKSNRLEVAVGDVVTGKYLKQPFIGEVIALRDSGQIRHVTVKFDTAVDVVTFDSFSNLRKQVHAVIDEDGRSKTKTSDGVPHMIIDP